MKDCDEDWFASNALALAAHFPSILDKSWRPTGAQDHDHFAEQLAAKNKHEAGLTRRKRPKKWQYW